MRREPSVWIATAVAALLSVPAIYAALRAYEVCFYREPNPATVVWTPHVAVFWRLLVSGYVAGMVAALAFAAARRDLARTLRVLCAGVLIVGAMVGLQGLLLP